MADTIAVMNRGRIEQLGSPGELYERPSTAFVAGFLGASNLLEGTATGPGTVRLEEGTEVEVDPAALAGRTGRVAVGIRPEKIRLGTDGANRIEGRVLESAYVGVSTQYVVETAAGLVTAYVQNAERASAPLERDARVTVSWSPDSTFVVDRHEEETP